MKALALSSLVLLSMACVPKTESKNEATSAAVNKNAPYLWSNYTTGKTIQISQSFSNDEVTNITDMATVWTTAIRSNSATYTTSGRTFFSIGARTPEITNAAINLDDLDNDGILGIYKTTYWPPELPTSALAVAQIFGERLNAGGANEFVRISHVDIMVNYDFYNFDTADSGANYDLRTVVLHELGHFLGLAHKSTSFARSDTVMYPSINSSEGKRTPMNIDIADLARKYGITLDSSSGAFNAVVANSSAIKYEAHPEATGQKTRVLMELMPDGECVHKIDGAAVGRHRID